MRFPTAALLAGLASALLFWILPDSVVSPPEAVLLMPLLTYFPALPLLVLGLLYGLPATLLAGTIALLILSPLAMEQESSLLITYLILSAAPAALIIQQLHQSVQAEVDDKPLTLWMPFSRLGVPLAGYMLLLILASLFVLQDFTTQDGSGARAFIHFTLQQASNTPEVSEEMKRAIAQQAELLTVIIPALRSWVHIAMLLGLTAIAYRIAARIGLPNRPPLHMDGMPPPPWLLIALGLAALAAWLGSPWLAFTGKIAFFIYLAPYLLFGMQPFHRALSGWPASSFWLTLAYGFAIVLFWPAIGIALYAIFRQCMLLRVEIK